MEVMRLKRLRIGPLFVFLERSLRAFRLSRASHVAGIMGIILALIALWQSAVDQRKTRQYQAWQAITLAQGKSGNGGRIAALQDLYKQRVSLRGVNLTGDTTRTHGGAYLRDLELPPRAGSFVDWLLRRTPKGVDLTEADLRGADLRDADLRNAILQKAKLQGADLTNAHLQGADLSHARLQDAELRGAQLQKADLTEANLENAHILFAVLTCADLCDANLEIHRPEGASGLFMTYPLDREGLLATRDWRGARLPERLREFALPDDASVEAMNRLGRTCKAMGPDW